MTSLSIETAFQWAQRFATREWRLLVPVALAFLALPPLALDVLVPAQWWATMQAAAQSGDPAAAASVIGVLFPLMLLVFAISTIGGLAIVALALRPGASVREAILLALRRLPTLIGSLLLLAIGELLAAMVLGILFGLARAGPASLQALLLGVMLGIGLVLGVRLLPLLPMVVARPIGPASALRESWVLTAGRFWRILGAVLIYVVGATVVVFAASSAIGAILLLIGRALAAPELGVVLSAVVYRAFASMAALGLYLLMASLYRQLEGV